MSLKEFIKKEKLDESKVVRAGVAVAKANTHKSQNAKIKSLSNSTRNNSQHGIRTDDTNEMLKAVLENQEMIAEILELRSIQSGALVTITLSNTLLQENIQKEIKKALKSQR